MARHRHICRLVGSFVNIPRLPIAEALTAAAAAVVYVVNMIVLRHTGCLKIGGLDLLTGCANKYGLIGEVKLGV